MKLYEFGPSRGLRVRWTLQELGVPFESIPVSLQAGEHQKAEYRKINPAGKLPALVDGDLTMTESVAICLHLAETHSEKKLIPPAGERAEFYRWLFFTVTELEEPLWRITRHSNVYPQERRLPAEIALAREQFAASAKLLEEHMKGREFVAGNSVSVADFVLGYTLDWASMFKLLDGLPVLTTYVERLYKRPAAPKRMVEIFAALRGANPPKAASG